jgi:hypothetical protein
LRACQRQTRGDHAGGRQRQPPRGRRGAAVRRRAPSRSGAPARAGGSWG